MNALQVFEYNNWKPLLHFERANKDKDLNNESNDRSLVGRLIRRKARVRIPGIRTKIRKYFFGDFLSADF